MTVFDYIYYAMAFVAGYGVTSFARQLLGELRGRRWDHEERVGDLEKQVADTRERVSVLEAEVAILWRERELMNPPPVQDGPFRTAVTPDDAVRSRFERVPGTSVPGSGKVRHD